jgi:hypothetical protein
MLEYLSPMQLPLFERDTPRYQWRRWVVMGEDSVRHLKASLVMCYSRVVAQCQSFTPLALWCRDDLATVYCEQLHLLGSNGYQYALVSDYPPKWDKIKEAPNLAMYLSPLPVDTKAPIL